MGILASNTITRILYLLLLLFFAVGYVFYTNRRTFQIDTNYIIEPLFETEEISNHLKKLNLTPNHSVKILMTDANELTKERILHGRFLHITDMHPDELNVIGGSIRRKCHKKLKSVVSNDDISHKYGDALSGCDSPIDLYKSTLEWIKENIKDHIDFVIWTGDNIRHDNDRFYPRTELDIFETNERVANDFVKTFMDDDEKDEIPFNRRVKIVPSLGNNDVYPHNLFALGPTLQTREMFKIWRDFIPTEQMHTFDRGAYFLREVIPGKLVVLSINTLYWFQSNPLNDNCDSRKQPGYKLFLWLGATLAECRRRGLKVWLSGHVPPIPKNIHHSCYSKISVWMHEYRDIIIGGVWGHMNIDHWVPLDSVKAWRSIEKRLLKLGALEQNENISYINYDNLGIFSQDESIFSNSDKEFEESEEFENDYETVEDLYRSLGIDIDDASSYPLHTFSDRYMGAPNGKVSYLENIRDSMYMKLKGNKKGGVHYERYSIAHISSSVIPTYNPGMRVWEYNVTEFGSLENLDYTNNDNGLFYNILNYFTESKFRKSNVLKGENWTGFFQKLEEILTDEDEYEKMASQMEDDENLFQNQEYLDLMSPKKDNTIPNIMPKELSLGPAYIAQTFSPENYVQYFVDLNKLNYDIDDVDKWKFEYKVHYSTKENSALDNLLVENWVKLGRKLAKSAAGSEEGQEIKIEANDSDDNMEIAVKGEKLWQKFIDRAFMSSGYQNLPDATS